MDWMKKTVAEVVEAGMQKAFDTAETEEEEMAYMAATAAVQASEDGKRTIEELGNMIEELGNVVAQEMDMADPDVFEEFCKAVIGFNG